RATLDRWYRFLADLEPTGGENREVEECVVSALSDDLNTPQALSEISQNLGRRRRAGALALTDDQHWKFIQAARLMGLLQLSPQEWFQGRIFEGSASFTVTSSLTANATVIRGREYIEKRIAARAEAKQRRDFAEADRIRAELADEGILLEDGPQGTTWRRA
ncbi:MAG TPA: DALR domain-containing protein, partial [Allosphingosinicella sp.]